MQAIPLMRNLLIGDIKAVLQMSRDEGWISGIKEFFHILSVNPDGCFAIEQDKQLIGCITTFIYEKSAWIGNFIISPEYRNQGLGSKLFGQALQYLVGNGLTTIYLTAAPKAVNLYKRYDFDELTTINRWEKDVLPITPAVKIPAAKNSTRSRIIAFDRQSWQEDRSILIDSLWSRRNCFELQNHYGFIMFSRIQKLKFIGPWEVAGNDILIAEKLLQGIFSIIRKKETFILDVPAANWAATTLLAHHGFSIKGTTTLMVHGVKPQVNFEQIFAMGSLGSIG